jgi:DNA processing protein
VARLGGHLETCRERVVELLGLPDDELVAAVGGRHARAVSAELAKLDPTALAAPRVPTGLEPICRCDPDYPTRLRAASAPPAVLYVAGGLDHFLELVAGEPVAIVGARRASDYGLEVARALGGALGCAGLTVISGMALGIDAAAHGGALAAAGSTIAVLPGGADQPYPASKRALYKRIRAEGAAVSELPPGSGAWRWSFPARNRIIAALSAMTVVVEARKRSGALLTAAHARELGRVVGAVPGRITAPLAAGPNALLADGALVVRGPQDVLDAIYGAGVRTATARARAALEPEHGRVLEAIADGHDTVAALTRAGVAPEQGLAAVSALELAGYVRREAGGRYSVVP